MNLRFQSGEPLENPLARAAASAAENVSPSPIEKEEALADAAASHSLKRGARWWPRFQSSMKACAEASACEKETAGTPGKAEEDIGGVQFVSMEFALPDCSARLLDN
jgi:hypothetical protein